MIGLVNVEAAGIIGAALVTAAGLLGGGMTLGRRVERRRKGGCGQNSGSYCDVHERVYAVVQEQGKQITDQGTDIAVITTEIGGLTKLFEARFDAQAGSIRAITESVQAVHKRLDKLKVEPS